MDSMNINKGMAAVLVAGIATGEAMVKNLCVACHAFNDGAKAGPWTFGELNAWVHQPSSYVPGTRMSFAGIKNDQERADVIDYPRTLSSTPVALPAP